MDTNAEQPIDPFVPKCLDCGYELTGLPDGTCPECGHAFTMDLLFAAERAKRDRLGLLRKSVLTVPLAGSLAVSCFGSSAQSYWFFGVLLAIVCGSGYLYFRLWYDVLLTRSHVLLALLLPLFTLLIGISTNASPWAGVAIIICVSTLVSWAALRWSPLISAGLILALIALPMLGSGVLMVTDGFLKQTKNAHWSEFDWPALPRWKALTAAEAVVTGFAVITCGVAIGITTIFYARRVLVRLRRLGFFRMPREEFLGQLRILSPW